jgi:hypothetical protein
LKGVTVAATLGKGFAAGVAVSLAVAGATHFGKPAERSGASVPATRETPVEQRRSVAFIPQRGDAAPSSTPPSATAETRATVNPSPELPMQLPSSATRSPEPDGPSIVTPNSTGTFPLAPQSRLEEEAALLRQARAQLRRGQPSAALATMEASRREFAAPELRQEREALTIEILHAGGQHAEAKARGLDFLARYPESPHAARIRSFVRP